METLRRLSNKITGRPSSGPSGAAAPVAPPAAEEATPKPAAVQVESERAQPVAEGSSEGSAPCSPLTGRPLSPRAQRVR